jgi:hypothetical protein
MNSVSLLPQRQRILLLALIAVPVCLLAGSTTSLAQSPAAASSNSNGRNADTATRDFAAAPQPRETDPTNVIERDSLQGGNTQFRVERLPIRNGAEMFTIFAKFGDKAATEDLPLLSVVRDTLGDGDPENDRLRYVWMLSYAKPSWRQRLAAAIPFFYTRVGNRSVPAKGPPPLLLNTETAKQTAWRKLFWLGLQNFVLDSQGFAVRATTRTYTRNAAAYRTAQVTQALSILSMYERMSRLRDENATLANLNTNTEKTPDGKQVVRTSLTSGDSKTSLASPLRSSTLTVSDALELRTRLILAEKAFGGFTSSTAFPRLIARQTIKNQETIGRNWDLLRQSAEAAGLYFDPLKMPDGTATHAMLWIARSDLAIPHASKTPLRFLNIADPWKDERLRAWSGYAKVVYFNSDDRQLDKNVPGARAVEMIPLAVYGLDNPKIPTLLVDFRDKSNPKKRELSQRIFRDVTTNVFDLSVLNVPYFLGKTAFNWITHRRGIDINQPSRVKSYAELKLLLTLNSEMDSGLRSEIERRIEAVSSDPLSNDRAAEVQLARQQYAALIRFASDPDGLAAKVDRDRRAEMTPLKHGRAARILFGVGNVLTFGCYVHRETTTPELMQRMELARRLEYHSRFLREVAASSARIEIATDMNEVKRSLRLLTDNADNAGGAGLKAAVRVFSRTDDSEARRLCLDTLSRIKGRAAKHALVRIYHDRETNPEWRTIVAEYLRRAVNEDRKLTNAEAKALLSQLGEK